MRHDTWIEDDVDGPDNHPGCQRDQRSRAPAGPRPRAGSRLRCDHDAKCHCHNQQSGDLCRCHRTACHPEPQERTSISSTQPTDKCPCNEHSGQRERDIDSVEMPQAEHQWIEQPEQRRDDARPQAEEEGGQCIECDCECAALQQRDESRGKRHPMHGAGLHLRRDESSAVAVLVVDRPLPGGDHGIDGQHRKNRQHLEEWRMLGVVCQVVVEDGHRARGHVDGLVERRRVVPSFEPAQDKEGDEGDQHQPEPDPSR